MHQRDTHLLSKILVGGDYKLTGTGLHSFQPIIKHNKVLVGGDYKLTGPGLQSL